MIGHIPRTPGLSKRSFPFFLEDAKHKQAVRQELLEMQLLSSPKQLLLSKHVSRTSSCSAFLTRVLYTSSRPHAYLNKTDFLQPCDKSASRSKTLLRCFFQGKRLGVQPAKAGWSLHCLKKKQLYSNYCLWQIG